MFTSQVSETDGQKNRRLNKSAVTELIDGDESQFGLNTIENEVLSIDDNSDVLTSSEETPPLLLLHLMSKSCFLRLNG